MSDKAFSKIMRGLEEVKAYTEGEREGYKVTVPPSVDVKSIRKGLNMTQAVFSDSFGFSLDTVKHWEGGRRTPEVPARAYLTVIQRNPSAVLEALHPRTATKEQVKVAVERYKKERKNPNETCYGLGSDKCIRICNKLRNRRWPRSIAWILLSCILFTISDLAHFRSYTGRSCANLIPGSS